MDTETLELFVEVVRRGSFAAVARDRELAPSSVSRAVGNLEAALGVRLLQRSTRGLSPTEAGARYAADVAPLLDGLRDAAEGVRDAGRPQGRLRIAAPLTFAQLHVVPRLPELAAAYPELAFELVMDSRLVDLVAERFDVAIRLGQPGDSELVGTRLAPMRYALVASPAYLARWGHPETPGALRDHDCLRYPIRGVGARWRFRARGDAEVQDVAIEGRFVVSSGQALRQLAEAGMGIALLPRWNVSDALREGTLEALLPSYDVTASRFDVSAWVLYPSRTHLPAKVRVFVDFLRGTLADLD
ncbi:MAG: LysR family transcriptional regulator [Myxococcota bacterium]